MLSRASGLITLLIPGLLNIDLYRRSGKRFLCVSTPRRFIQRSFVPATEYIPSKSISSKSVFNGLRRIRIEAAVRPARHSNQAHIPNTECSRDRHFFFFFLFFTSSERKSLLHNRGVFMVMYLFSISICYRARSRPPSEFVNYFFPPSSIK